MKKTCSNCYWSNKGESISGRIVKCEKLHARVNGKKDRSKCMHWCVLPPIRRKSNSYFDMNVFR